MLSNRRSLYHFEDLWVVLEDTPRLSNTKDIQEAWVDGQRSLLSSCFIS